MPEIRAARPRSWILTLALGLFAAVPLAATSFVGVSDEALVDQARVAVVARVVSAAPRAVVPEPATLTLLAGGLLALVAHLLRELVRRRYRHHRAGVGDLLAHRGPRPQQVERAERDPKHRMALVFRAYLGLSSRWAIDGLAERSSDYQIWCGPAMGAFNDWVRGTFLEEQSRRTVAQIGLNLLDDIKTSVTAAALKKLR